MVSITRFETKTKFPVRVLTALQQFYNAKTRKCKHVNNYHVPIQIRRILFNKFFKI